MGIQGYISLAIILVIQINSVTSAGWSYSGADGPSNWVKSYPDCGGSSQSPINIISGDATVSTSLGSVKLNNYDTAPTSMTLINNGHTVQVNIVGSQTISDGGLPTTYKLAQFHFHWGSSGSSDGSEHQIDGKAYPLEVHFVHYNSTYSSLTAAAAAPNGLAVLGFFFEVTSSDNSALDPIINGIASVVNKDSTKAITAFAVSDILPDMTNFYRYPGSLTTPGCYESVIWSVFDQKIKISKTQLAKFLTAKDASGNGIVDNFRPVQKLNSRTVKASFNPNSAATSRPMGALFAIAILSTWLLRN